MSRKEDDPYITNKRIRHIFLKCTETWREQFLNSKWWNGPLENNQLYQDNRIETFRQIYVQINMQVGKPKWKTGARFRGSETVGIDIDRITSVYRIT